MRRLGTLQDCEDSHMERSEFQGQRIYGFSKRVGPGTQGIFTWRDLGSRFRMWTGKGLTRRSWDPHSEIFMENAAKCHTRMCRQKDEGNPFGSPFCKVA